jgi:hypothetical protein
MEFLQALFSAWGRQVLALLLLPGLVGMALHYEERLTQQHLRRAIGSKGLVWWTGWLGTPVHELSHCLVGMLFGHKITEVKLWDPHPHDGVLGYVKYHLPSEDNRVLYYVARIGQFFSGIAPLFGGSLVLLLALKVLSPRPELVLDEAQRFATALEQRSWGDVGSGFTTLVQGIYGSLFAEGAASFRPWVFLYVALAVGAHLAPSPADMKGGAAGFGMILGIALVIDAVAVAAGAHPERAVGALGHVAGAASALLLVALVLNLGNLAFAFVVGTIAGRSGVDRSQD